MRNLNVDQDASVTPSRSSTPTVFVRFKKQKEPQSVRVAADHNKRARFFYQQGHEHDFEGGLLIARKNQKLWGPDTPEEVANLARSLMTQHGVKKLRKDAVRAIEVLLSLSFKHGINDTAFFTDSMYWFAEQFGGIENLLAADVHRDEANDHVHLLFLPLSDGRMVGSQMIGGKSKLKECKVNFDLEVCRAHGVKVLMSESLTGAQRVRASQTVLNHLAKAGDPVSASKVWDAVRYSINSKPEPYLNALGIDISEFRQLKKLKTMAEIFTSVGKGARNRKDERLSLC